MANAYHLHRSRPCRCKLQRGVAGYCAAPEGEVADVET